jgi:hypothetical protein
LNFIALSRAISLGVLSWVLDLANLQVLPVKIDCSQLPAPHLPPCAMPLVNQHSSIVAKEISESVLQ